MLKKYFWLLGFILILWGGSVFAGYYSCWDISLADEKYVEFRLEKEFGKNTVSRVNEIYKYIVVQSTQNSTNYDYQISYISQIMNSLEKNWCYLDQGDLDGSNYLGWKKLTYQLLWLKLDSYLHFLNTQKFQSWLGIKD